MIKSLLKFWNWLIGKSFKKQTVKIEYPYYPLKDFDLSVFDEINEYRNSKGLPKLEFLRGPFLNITASYPNWLTENDIDFSDKERPENHSYFQERADQIKLRYVGITRIGENLGFNYPDPKSLVKAWSQSEGHRKTMEGDFKYIAVASCGKFTNSIYIK